MNNSGSLTATRIFVILKFAFYLSHTAMFKHIMLLNLQKRGGKKMSDCTSCNEKAISTASDTAVDQPCPAIGYQKVNVCVPVSVTPFAKTGATSTNCCGDPVVTEGDTPCSGVKNGVCNFTISQTICIEVPVEFGATATVGDTYVDCLGSSSEDICKNCNSEEGE
jgi:hypothetical protein